MAHRWRVDRTRKGMGMAPSPMSTRYEELYFLRASMRDHGMVTAPPLEERVTPSLHKVKVHVPTRHDLKKNMVVPNVAIIASSRRLLKREAFPGSVRNDCA